MSVEVTLPELGESVTEGTVTQWLKAVGDTVEVDEPLLEVSTDKVDTEVPSPVAGTVLKILAEEDETVEVGGVLVVIGDPSEADAPGEPSDETPAAMPSPDAATTTTPSAPAQPSGESAPRTEQPASTATSAAAEGQKVTLPELGESVTEGTVTRWLKSVGDTVDVDEPIVEVSTDKVDTEVPSPFAGTLLEIAAEEDETVDVGGVLAIVGDPSTQSTSATPSAPAETHRAAVDIPEAQPESEPEATEPSTAVSESREASPSESAPSRSTAKHAAENSASSTVYVTPIVRKLATQLGVDLTTVKGTGVGGRIRREDVQAAVPQTPSTGAHGQHAAVSTGTAESAPKPEASPLVGTTQPLSRLRKVLGKSMVTSLQTQAQLTTVVEIDITNVAKLRAQYKDDFLKQTGSKLSFLPFFVLAAVEQLKAYPMINSSINDQEVTYHDGVNLNVAVETERGLYAPVIKHADTLTIREIGEAIADLATRARDNALKPDDLMGGTFTLTNTGSRGALFDTPVVALPQSAILGTGIAVKRPAVISVDGQDVIAIRQLAHFALSYDHRIVDGADAAKYLTAIKRRLEQADFTNDLGIDVA